MNNPEIRNEIVTLINRVKDTFDRFQELESIPQADLDEVVVAVENLYRKTVVLGYINTLQATRSENIPAEHNEAEAVVVEAETTVLSAEAEIIIENQTEVLQTPAEEHLPVAEAHVIAELTEETSVPVVEKTVVTQADSVAANETSSQKTQLADIKSGIGINDKFQFIAELFAGSGEKYEASIKHLNTLKSLDSSLLYLDEIRANYKWKEDSGSAERLVELVKQRFL